jgi:endonuclease IV
LLSVGYVLSPLKSLRLNENKITNIHLSGSKTKKGENKDRENLAYNNRIGNTQTVSQATNEELASFQNSSF